MNASCIANQNKSKEQHLNQPDAFQIYAIKTECLSCILQEYVLGKDLEISS